MNAWQKKVAKLSDPQKLELARKLEGMAHEIRIKTSGGISETKAPKFPDSQKEIWFSRQKLCTEKIAEKYFTWLKSEPNLYELAQFGILNCALANWGILEPHFLAQTRYAKAEGLTLFDLWSVKQQQETIRLKRKAKTK